MQKENFNTNLNFGIYILAFINKKDVLMADAKESEGIVLVDLCKPYRVDLSEKAYEIKRFFLGYVQPDQSKIDEEHKNTFKDIYSALKKVIDQKEVTENKDNSDIGNIKNNVIVNLKRLGPLVSKNGKQGIFRDLTTEKNEEKNDEKNRMDTVIYNIIHDMNKKVNDKEPVYVIVPHVPYLYIGKVKNLRYYGEELNDKFYDELLNLLIYFYKGIGKREQEKLIGPDEKYEDYRRDFFGQLIQSFEVEDFRRFNYVDLPLSFLMIPSVQARLYKSDTEEHKDFISMVKELYENGKITKRRNWNLTLKWLTPTSMEILSSSLLKYENSDCEIYHIGGAGDNGIDVIGMHEKEVKFVAQCKTSFKVKDIEYYCKKVGNEIKLYYIVTDEEPREENVKTKIEEIKNKYNVEVWDKNKLLELIKKHIDNIKNTNQYLAILNQLNKYD